MKTAELPPNPPHDAKLSVAAYQALGEAGLIPKDTELLYGVVYRKMSKSPLHSALVGRLLKLLRNLRLPGLLIRSEQPITCRDSEPEPDVAVVRGTDEDFWHRHPSTAALAIEVCVTSHDYDRSKLHAFAGADVQEVWFVLVPEKQIEVHRHPINGRYAEKQTFGTGRVVSANVPGFEVEIESFFKK
jgi:Uma2 family endonuclease